MDSDFEVVEEALRALVIRAIGINVNDRWYAFDDYTDEHLNTRIAYWESGASDDFCGVLSSLYAERDRRVDQKLLEWVETK